MVSEPGGWNFAPVANAICQEQAASHGPVPGVPGPPCPVVAEVAVPDGPVPAIPAPMHDHLES